MSRWRRAVAAPRLRRVSLVRCAAASAALLVTPGAPADIEAGRRKAEACAACHGRDGNSVNPTTPSIAGQPPLYTFLQLIQFREKRRKDPQMSPFAANLSDRDMQDLAAYYAAQKPAARRHPTDARKVAAGRHVADAHHCASCHAAGLTGQDHVPRLVGLEYDYLLRQLRGYKAQTRADIDGAMTTAAQLLSDQDIENLAHYIADLQSKL
jgi:cytochrome c553